MCIRVHTAPISSITPWDHTHQAITIPTGLPPEAQAVALRAVLSELGIPQPAAGAVCWCGAPIDLPRSTEQRSGQVIRHAS